jgi:hypothetical protein
MKPSSGQSFTGPQPLLAFFDLTVGPRDVQLVDVDRCAVFAMQSRGEADVIGVTVRQQ